MRGIVRELVLVAALLFVVRGAVLLRLPSADGNVPLGLVAVIFGFALVTAHLVGRMAGTATLPRITGYLVAGVLVGPHLLGLVSLGVKDQLGVINQIALGLIALTAGGELVLSDLRPRLRTIASVTLTQTFPVFVGTAVLVPVVVGGLRRLGVEAPLLEGWGAGHLWAAGLILGLVATANSPSTTVAVINETEAKGAVTTVSLGVTVIKDVLVIILMAITLTVTTRLVGASAAEGSAWSVGGEIALSLLAGGLVGGALILYLARINREVALTLLVTVFLTIEGSELFHRAFGFDLHFILVCVTAGFVVENASERGRALIRGLEKTSLPVYVIFFTLSGVGLDLDALGQLWPAALFFVLWRGALMWVTTWGGARLAGAEETVVRFSWTAFLAQAGISLGLAELVGERFPEIGAPLKTLVLAVVAMNQIVGPILFKLSLQRAGETGRA